MAYNSDESLQPVFEPGFAELQLTRDGRLTDPADVPMAYIRPTPAGLLYVSQQAQDAYGFETLRPVQADDQSAAGPDGRIDVFLLGPQEGLKMQRWWPDEDAAKKVAAEVGPVAARVQTEPHKKGVAIGIALEESDAYQPHALCMVLGSVAAEAAQDYLHEQSNRRAVSASRLRTAVLAAGLGTVAAIDVAHNTGGRAPLVALGVLGLAYLKLQHHGFRQYVRRQDAYADMVSRQGDLLGRRVSRALHNTFCQAPAG